MYHPPLFVRSNFTFLKSTLRIEDILDFSLSKGYKHALITDFKNSYAWVNFYKSCRKKGLKPIFGLEVNYLNSIVLLIAFNKTGYENLIRTSTYGLSPHHLEGIVVIHLDGEVTLSEHSHFYMANSEEPNGVYVQENKFLNKEDYEFFCLLRSIENQSLLSEELELNRHFADDYLNKECPYDENSHLVKNIYRILDLCQDYEIFDNSGKLQFFRNSNETLRQLSDLALKRLTFDSDESFRIYRERLDLELSVVIQKGFADYFLIVQEAVSWAKNNDICIGPGRGSVCGSLLAYVLGITEVDPIKYELYFERFLNPEREIIPDIDIDISNNKRHLLLEHLRDRYGSDHVSLIITFSTFKSKNSVREIARSFGLPKEKVDSANENNFSHKQKELLNRILDFPKNSSIHAAGVIISSAPLSSLVPLISKENSLNVTQWEADDLKELNLIKFDFLALHHLSVMDEIVNNIEDDLDLDLDWSSIDENDPKVYELLISGKTSFIFQFDSPKIKELIQKFKPSSLLDLALLSAIHRPGASDQIPALLNRKFSNSQKDSLPEPFNSRLGDTYGLIIYQEQVMQIISQITSSHFGYSDNFRRNLSDPNKIEECSKTFFERGLKNGYSEKDLNLIWSYISKFASYGFNKSHAVAYAIISYRLLWLKTYYPQYFYKEILDFSDSAECFSEIQSSGFNFQYPKLGTSLLKEFFFSNNSIYFPLSRIVKLSPSFFEKFPEGKRYDSVLDALKHLVSLKISKEDLLILIRIGFFQSKEHPHFWASNLDEVHSFSLFVREDNQSLFDLNLSDVEITDEIKKEYRAYPSKYLGIDLDRWSLNSAVFEKNASLRSIISLPTQKESSQKYLAFLSSIKAAKSSAGKDFWWLIFAERLYISQRVAYFGSEIKSLQEALSMNYAVLATIDRNKDFFTVSKVKVFKR
ncbi:DNA polymerase III, alpha subunit [Mycoplasma haemofelis Ohio2]|uniref:DNA polymerase III, alpha subunit n=1 Tax=Mycoplasma haemofelis (strain Ohio2) TaxID=859194 RepID=F6FFJ7_MYCHI|nr:DNA polymerase III, alpha subunit [Mycoplasma haemofelis Ohio2]